MIYSSRILILLSIQLVLLTGCSSIGRTILFQPTYKQNSSFLTQWNVNNETVGYSRLADSPENIWLVLHGNGGQASGRTYMIPHFSESDSVYILEYPGYGTRSGSPSRESIDTAAKEAYLSLRERFPSIPLSIAAESIGSGPALTLVDLPKQPDKYVLIVPFDNLSRVINYHTNRIVSSLFIRDNWNNITAIQNYNGPVDIYGAEDDQLIPLEHARRLAQSYPDSNFTILRGGHNEWSRHRNLRFRYP